MLLRNKKLVSNALKMPSHQNQEDKEAPPKKKRKINIYESVAALIKQPCLLRLNPDILEQILPHFSLILTDGPQAENLRKFMASGREPFFAALRYFSHVKSIEVTANHLRICVKRFPVTKNKVRNRHIIPYDFEFMDKILVVLAKFYNALFIRYDFKYDSQSDTVKRTFAKLLRKDLECVYFESWKIPTDYVRFFKAECSFNEIQILLCNVGKPVLTDFLEMVSSRHYIITHFQSFYHRILCFPQDRTFPTVKHLIIDFGCNCKFPDYFNFLFTKDAIMDFFNRIAQHFPNLEGLNVSCYSMPEEMNIHWEIVYNEMMKFTPQIFSNLPSHIKGSILFEFRDLFTSFNYVFDEIDGRDDDIEIVDNYYRIPSEASKLIKRFNIHEGLTFQYEFIFPREMSDDSLIQWQQLNSDNSDGGEETEDDEENGGEDDDSENQDDKNQSGDEDDGENKEENEEKESKSEKIASN